jgi:phospholipase/carboxylesterase
METGQQPALPFLEIGAPREEADLSVILMHGLGADGHDFADVAQALCHAAHPRRWRFVLPHAPQMPVTINMGMTMPAWYDILSLDHPRAVDWNTVAASQMQLEDLVAAESTPNLVLAGFSQGAAMALQIGLRHQAKISGILVMSGYLLESEDHPAPPSEGPLPIAILHGDQDSVVPLEAAESALQLLKAAGYAPTFQTYPGLDHSVSETEVHDVLSWLQARDR